MFKKILKFIGVLALTTLILFIGTFISQKLMIISGLPLTDFQVERYSGTIGILTAAISIAVISHKRGWCKDMKTRRFKIDHRVIPVAFSAISICTVLVASLFALAINKILPQASDVSTYKTWLDHVFCILIAPIAEELLFRQGIYGALRNSFNRKAALIISAVLFTAAHGYQIQGTLQVLLAGLLLAYVFEKTGNIWYSISAHMALNAFSSISNYLVHKGIPFYSEINGYVVYHAAVMAAAIVIIIATFIAFRKKENKDRVQSPCC